MEKKNYSVDEWIKELEKEVEKRGLPKPKHGNKTGHFIIIVPKNSSFAKKLRTNEIRKYNKYEKYIIENNKPAYPRSTPIKVIEKEATKDIPNNKKFLNSIPIEEKIRQKNIEIEIKKAESCTKSNNCTTYNIKHKLLDFKNRTLKRIVKYKINLFYNKYNSYEEYKEKAILSLMHFHNYSRFSAEKKYNEYEEELFEKFTNKKELLPVVAAYYIYLEF